MALTDLLPIDRFVHPMPPVLSGTYWLAIHVPIIMVGYAVLALGMVVAHMQIGVAGLRSPAAERRPPMADLQYWYIHVGSILLVAGILTGSMWAASSWGRYWGWDPKEVWSLVAFLAYMAILHARAERLIGDFGVAAWSIAAFQTILMTYLGVNFVLASGLHSYGFGDSSVVLGDAGRGPRRGGLRRRRLGDGAKPRAAAPSATATATGRHPPGRVQAGGLLQRLHDRADVLAAVALGARGLEDLADRGEAGHRGTLRAAACSSMSVWSLTRRSIAKCSSKSRFAMAAPLKA